MSMMFRPPTLRRSRAIPRLSARPFSTTTPSLSALFNLNGLAHSRESQYLSKERGIPRTEYSSNIHLIRSSEVDPFPNAPGASRHANESRSSARKRAGRHATIATMHETDDIALQRFLDDTHPGQQRESIEQLMAQLRAAREEIARLRATTHGVGLDRGDVRYDPRRANRLNRSLLILIGGLSLFSLCTWIWNDPSTNVMIEDARRQVEEAKVAAASQAEESEGPKAVTASISVPAIVAEKDPQYPQRGQKSPSPLSFLWAKS